MTRNKEPGKGKFHGQDLSYFIFGNNGWGGGGGGGGGEGGRVLKGSMGMDTLLPLPGRTSPMIGSILITLQNLA